jgi:hypothetical protein
MSTTGKSKGYGIRRLRLYIRTFGWPLVQVPRDDFEDTKEDKWLGVKKMEKIFKGGKSSF